MKDAELSARYRRLSKRALRVLRELEAIRPSQLRLSCDRWGHGRAIGELTWAAENLDVIAEHLCGRSLADDMGYWTPHKAERGWSKAMRSRVLYEGETVLMANRAEFEMVRRARTVGSGKKRARRANESKT